MNNIPQTPEEYRRWCAKQRPNIPYGKCWCGCGDSTAPYTQTNRAVIHYKGEPARYLPGHHKRLQGAEYTIEDRGYSTPCWIWTASTDGQWGYGQAGWHPSRKAHRYMYEKLRGPIPDGLVLDHLCRVQPCVNPDHLDPVSFATNMRRGKNTKLTEQNVREIRILLQEGLLAIKDIAMRYGVSSESIRAIKHRRTWRDIA